MKHLAATSEQLRALIVALLAVALREVAPPLRDVDLEAILIPIVGYMIARALKDRSGKELRNVAAGRGGLGKVPEPGAGPELRQLGQSPAEVDDELV